MYVVLVLSLKRRISECSSIFEQPCGTVILMSNSILAIICGFLKPANVASDRWIAAGIYDAFAVDPVDVNCGSVVVI